MNNSKALKSIEYYIEFLQKIQKDNLKVPASHDSIFKFDNNSKSYYQKLYLQQQNKKDKDIARRSNNPFCNECSNFFLEERKKIDKRKDLVLGNKLEYHFQSFIEEKLNTALAASGKNISIKCVRADEENMHMPDFKIVRVHDDKTLAFFEFKCIFRPFINISSFVHEDFKCYSHSLTLDKGSKNIKQKLQNQRDLVQKLDINNVDYVYWYDIPCIKGIFSLSAKKVYDLMDNQKVYTRQSSRGDYNKKGIKIGSDDKIYLPLVNMDDFRNLLNKYYALAIA
ncbi:hypothetical protein BCW_0927 [Bacillus cereus W]|uniref:hypothetical protein n=1 Tax=Bacillus anthracis TaxID=1392 RepID=UPI00016B274B|nr:hypothetical protein [Bacillus anthracis]EDX56190.1 hypothetical protein BCW_0927 [Bacillus cereus W]MEB9525846.1 hypothetical protein [Bacillus anthracis]MEC0042500.1 hypothetical protein [Bacillus anthracis]